MSRRPLLGLLALLAACGGRPASLPAPGPVPVDGSRADRRALAGDWLGEFRDQRGDRTGSISFSLRAGRDTALGRVLLAGKVAGPIVLTLARVGVDDGSVGGWLAPYRDPERKGWVDTWFEGRMIAGGDRIEGMYFAHPADTSAVRTGTWWVERVR